MHKVIENILEMLIGIILFGAGLLFLVFHSKTSDQLIKKVEQNLMEEGALYQQYSTVDIMLVSSQELYATILGNREYPIVIDSNVIEKDGNDYGLYFTYIKEGFYKKSYSYDAAHNITQIIYEYTGS